MGILCLCLSLFCCALPCVLPSFATVLKRKRELVALLLFSKGCLVTVNVLLHYLMVPWVGLRCVIKVYSDHTQLLLKLYYIPVSMGLYPPSNKCHYNSLLVNCGQKMIAHWDTIFLFLKKTTTTASLCK